VLVLEGDRLVSTTRKGHGCLDRVWAYCDRFFPRIVDHLYISLGPEQNKVGMLRTHRLKTEQQRVLAFCRRHGWLKDMP
jgi:hypothetical protein